MDEKKTPRVGNTRFPFYEAFITAKEKAKEIGAAGIELAKKHPYATSLTTAALLAASTYGYFKSKDTKINIEKSINEFSSSLDNASGILKRTAVKLERTVDRMSVALFNAVKAATFMPVKAATMTIKKTEEMIKSSRQYKEFEEYYEDLKQAAKHQSINALFRMNPILALVGSGISGKIFNLSPNFLRRLSRKFSRSSERFVPEISEEELSEIMESIEEPTKTSLSPTPPQTKTSKIASPINIKELENFLKRLRLELINIHANRELDNLQKEFMSLKLKIDQQMLHNTEDIRKGINELRPSTHKTEEKSSLNRILTGAVFPYFASFYRKELPKVKSPKDLEAASFNTLSKMYITNRKGTDDTHKLLLQLTDVVKTGLGVEGNLWKPRTTSPSELATKFLRRILFPRSGRQFSPIFYPTIHQAPIATFPFEGIIDIQEYIERKALPFKVVPTTLQKAQLVYKGVRRSIEIAHTLARREAKRRLTGYASSETLFRSSSDVEKFTSDFIDRSTNLIKIIEEIGIKNKHLRKTGRLDTLLDDIRETKERIEGLRKGLRKLKEKRRNKNISPSELIEEENSLISLLTINIDEVTRQLEKIATYAIDLSESSYATDRIKEITENFTNALFQFKEQYTDKRIFLMSEFEKRKKRNLFFRNIIDYVWKSSRPGGLGRTFAQFLGKLAEGEGFKESFSQTFLKIIREHPAHKQIRKIRGVFPPLLEYLSIPIVSLFTAPFLIRKYLREGYSAPAAPIGSPPQTQTISENATPTERKVIIRYTNAFMDAVEKRSYRGTFFRGSEGRIGTFFGNLSPYARTGMIIGALPILLALASMSPKIVGTTALGSLAGLLLGGILGFPMGIPGMITLGGIGSAILGFQSLGGSLSKVSEVFTKLKSFRRPILQLALAGMVLGLPFGPAGMTIGLSLGSYLGYNIGEYYERLYPGRAEEELRKFTIFRSEISRDTLPGAVLGAVTGGLIGGPLAIPLGAALGLKIANHLNKKSEEPFGEKVTKGLRGIAERFKKDYDTRLFTILGGLLSSFIFGFSPATFTLGASAGYYLGTKISDYINVYKTFSPKGTVETLFRNRIIHSITSPNILLLSSTLGVVGMSLFGSIPAAISFAAAPVILNSLFGTGEIQSLVGKLTDMAENIIPGSTNEVAGDILMVSTISAALSLLSGVSFGQMALIVPFAYAALKGRFSLIKYMSDYLGEQVGKLVTLDSETLAKISLASLIGVAAGIQTSNPLIGIAAFLSSYLAIDTVATKIKNISNSLFPGTFRKETNLYLLLKEKEHHYSQSPTGYERGGIVTPSRRLAIVGEKGPELAILPTGTKIFNAHSTKRILSEGKTFAKLGSLGGEDSPTSSIIDIIFNRIERFLDTIFSYLGIKKTTREIISESTQSINNLFKSNKGNLSKENILNALIDSSESLTEISIEDYPLIKRLSTFLPLETKNIIYKRDLPEVIADLITPIYHQYFTNLLTESHASIWAMRRLTPLTAEYPVPITKDMIDSYKGKIKVSINRRELRDYILKKLRGERTKGLTYILGIENEPKREEIFSERAANLFISQILQGDNLNIPPTIKEFIENVVRPDINYDKNIDNITRRNYLTLLAPLISMLHDPLIIKEALRGTSPFSESRINKDAYIDTAMRYLFLTQWYGDKKSLSPTTLPIFIDYITQSQTFKNRFAKTSFRGDNIQKEIISYLLGWMYPIKRISTKEDLWSILFSPQYDKLEKEIKERKQQLLSFTEIPYSMESLSKKNEVIWPPLQDTEASISSLFGTRPNPFKPNELVFHKGIDIAAKKGTDVYALLPGIVTEYKHNDKIKGNYVVIYNEESGIYTEYFHLDEINENVTKNGYIEAGQKIGTVGSTGRSTGPHLHLGTYIIRNGEILHLDPLTLMGISGGSLLGKKIYSIRPNKSYFQLAKESIPPLLSKVKDKIYDISRTIGVDPSILTAAISSESDFNPTAENIKSKAVGILQWTRSTLSELGKSANEVKNMSLSEQLDLVKDYFIMVKNRLGIDKLRDLFETKLAIFYPAKTTAIPDEKLFEAGSIEYKNNNELDIDKDKTITAFEAVLPAINRFIQMAKSKAYNEIFPNIRNAIVVTEEKIKKMKDSKLANRIREILWPSNIGTEVQSTSSQTNIGGDAIPLSQPPILFFNIIVPSSKGPKNKNVIIDTNKLIEFNKILETEVSNNIATAKTIATESIKNFQMISENMEKMGQTLGSELKEYSNNMATVMDRSFRVVVTNIINNAQKAVENAKSSTRDDADNPFMKLLTKGFSK